MPGCLEKLTNACTPCGVKWRCLPSVLGGLETPFCVNVVLMGCSRASEVLSNLPWAQPHSKKSVDSGFLSIRQQTGPPHVCVCVCVEALCRRHTKSIE